MTALDTGSDRAAALRRLLAGGGVATGMQCFSGSPALIEAMAAGDLDFVTIDMEHSPTTLSDAAHLIRASDAAGITPLVRVPAIDAGEINRLLNLGAAGIVVPHASEESCRAALDAARYAPEGRRGSCPVVRSARYAQADWAAFTTRRNRDVLVIPLIEDIAALETFPELAAIEGIDAFFVGPFDLSVALGIPGRDFREPTMAAALRDLIAVARANGKWLMTTVGTSIDTEYAQTLIDAGVQLISFSADVLVFLEACRKIAGIGTGAGTAGK